jgi:hypothetical protein
MVSTVKSRPNYYEMLGLTPSAAGDAIARAFAQATSVFRPHMFGGITEICVAYETLRDPAKRRAYDASLGLAPKPNISSISRPASAHFMRRPAVAVAPPTPSAEQPAAAPRVEAPPEASAKPQPRPAPPIERTPEPSFAPLPSLPGYDGASVGYRPIEWKRTGAILGGLAAAAVLVGALTGWWSGSSAVAPEFAAPAVAAAPEEKAPPSLSELWAESPPQVKETQAARPRAPAASWRLVERLARRATVAATEVERQLVQPPQDLADPVEADPLAPESAPAPTPAVASTMPLPHKTVARTIDRIGYRCGSVASATPVEGAAGVYTVTCTSGQSFQAKPVNGRYRFRRLAKN